MIDAKAPASSSASAASPAAAAAKPVEQAEVKAVVVEGRTCRGCSGCMVMKLPDAKYLCMSCGGFDVIPTKEATWLVRVAGHQFNMKEKAKIPKETRAIIRRFYARILEAGRLNTNHALLDQLDVAAADFLQDTSFLPGGYDSEGCRSEDDE